MKLVSKGKVFRDANLHCAMPSVIRSPSGEYLCAFRQAPDRRRLGQSTVTHCDTNSYLMMCHSKDGRNWTAPTLLYAHPLGGCQDPCLFLTHERTLLCSTYGYVAVGSEFKNTERHLHYGPYHFLGGFILRSTDSGKTWQESNPLPRHDLNQALDYAGMPYTPFNRGSFAQDKATGRIYWAATRHASMKPARGAIDLFCSENDGQTWQLLCPIAENNDVSFNEVSLLITPDKRIVAFIRSFNANDALFVAEADDCNSPEFRLRQKDCSGHPYQATILEDDSVFLSYAQRGEKNRICARILKGPEYSLAQSPEHILIDGGGSWDIGYPWSCTMDNGNLLLLYYWNEDDRERYIAWAEISP